MEIAGFPASPAAVTVEASRRGFGDMLRMHQLFVVFFFKVFFLEVTLLTILPHAAGSHGQGDVHGSILEVFSVCSASDGLQQIKMTAGARDLLFLQHGMGNSLAAGFLDGFFRERVA